MLVICISSQLDYLVDMYSISSILDYVGDMYILSPWLFGWYVYPLTLTMWVIDLILNVSPLTLTMWVICKYSNLDHVGDIYNLWPWLYGWYVSPLTLTMWAIFLGCSQQGHDNSALGIKKYSKCKTDFWVVVVVEDYGFLLDFCIPVSWPPRRWRGPCRCPPWRGCRRGPWGPPWRPSSPGPTRQSGCSRPPRGATQMKPCAHAHCSDSPVRLLLSTYGGNRDET